MLAFVLSHLFYIVLAFMSLSMLQNNNQVGSFVALLTSPFIYPLLLCLLPTIVMY